VITWQYAKAAGQRYKPTLLLTTIGRRTGQLRPRALPYHREGRAYVVVGSNGGGPSDPDWVRNVRDNDAAWVTVGRREIPVRAHVAEGDERERLVARIGQTGDSLARYQERAATFGRTVPLVVLTPRA
jgi:deazaflavin-dependent oxidoreductase (nitroreductase family)